MSKAFFSLSLVSLDSSLIRGSLNRNKKTRLFKQVVSAAKQTDTFIGAFTVYNLAGVTAPCLKILFEVIIPHTAAEVKSYCTYIFYRAPPPINS